MFKLQALVIITFLSFNALAQDNPRPTKSRFYSSRYSTFQMKANDILVYTIQTDSSKYDMIVTVKQFGSSLGFIITVPSKKITENIIVNADDVMEQRKYDNLFTNIQSKFTQLSTVWLSKSNYRDLAADGETMMDMGNGREKFIKTNTGSLKINYKGKLKIITLFNIVNEGTNGEHNNARKAFAVLTDLNNPLIISMDFGWKMTLKEVR